MTKTTTGKGRCIVCGKEKSAVKCEGCSQIFCFDHLPIHHQELNMQLHEIEMNRDLFRQMLTEQVNNLGKHSFIKQIDQWEAESIKLIEQTAKQCRQLVLQHTDQYLIEIEINLAHFTDQLRQIRRENDFNEIELNEFKHRLKQLQRELDRPPNISIQQDTTSFINKISVVVSTGKCILLQENDLNRYLKSGEIYVHVHLRAYTVEPVGSALYP
jgi:hypothetical protein